MGLTIVWSDNAAAAALGKPETTTNLRSQESKKGRTGQEMQPRLSLKSVVLSAECQEHVAL